MHDLIHRAFSTHPCLDFLTTPTLEIHFLHTDMFYVYEAKAPKPLTTTYLNMTKTASKSGQAN